MGVTIEDFLTKRITILKEMLERLPDDSAFNRGARAAYKDELFMCENMYENILAKHKTEVEPQKKEINGMIIYTCPKCGGPLQFSTIAIYPPIHVTECFSCGWREEVKDGDNTADL